MIRKNEKEIPADVLNALRQLTPELMGLLRAFLFGLTSK